MYQSRALLRHIFDQDIPSPVPQEAEQRGGVFVLLDAGSHLYHAVASRREEFDLIATGVLEQEPAGATLSRQRRVGLSCTQFPTYHPPASVTAASWASLTLASSSPFSDISGFQLESQLWMGESVWAVPRRHRMIVSPPYGRLCFQSVVRSFVLVHVPLVSQQYRVMAQRYG